MRNLYCLDQAPAGNAGLSGSLLNGGLALFGLSAAALWWTSSSDSAATVEKLKAALQSKATELEELRISNQARNSNFHEWESKMSKLPEGHMMETPSNSIFNKDAFKYVQDPEKNFFAKLSGMITKKNFTCVAGNKPIFQTKNVMAILDFMPVARGHSLLISRLKYATVMDMPSTIAADFMSQLSRLARIVQKATKADGITILSGNGNTAAQNCMSATFHVIPWYEDKHDTWGIKVGDKVRLKTREKCTECKGTGKTDGEECKKCHGLKSGALDNKSIEGKITKRYRAPLNKDTTFVVEGYQYRAKGADITMLDTRKVTNPVIKLYIGKRVVTRDDLKGADAEQGKQQFKDAGELLPLFAEADVELHPELHTAK